MIPVYPVILSKMKFTRLVANTTIPKPPKWWMTAKPTANAVTDRISVRTFVAERSSSSDEFVTADAKLTGPDDC